MDKDKKFERVLVTVGTTSFNGLIDLILSPKTSEQFRKWGTKEVHVQMGDYPRDVSNFNFGNGTTVKFFKRKPSLEDDMTWADLVISHAGAGTTLDALGLGKILIVIPNEDLMDNHQQELADHLTKEKYAYSSNLKDFHSLCTKVSRKSIRPFPPAINTDILNKFIEESVLGLDPEKVAEAKMLYEKRNR